MNEPFEMTLYARLHTSYRREVWVGYGGKDTLFYLHGFRRMVEEGLAVPL